MITYKKLLYKMIDEYLELKNITDTSCKNCVAYKYCKDTELYCNKNIEQALKTKIKKKKIGGICESNRRKI